MAFVDEMSLSRIYAGAHVRTSNEHAEAIGREVARFEWRSPEVRDPIVSFKLRADREAPLTMTWRDDRGAVFEKSVDVTFR